MAVCLLQGEQCRSRMYTPLLCMMHIRGAGLTHCLFDFSSGYTNNIIVMEEDAFISCLIFAK